MSDAKDPRSSAERLHQAICDAYGLTDFARALRFGMGVRLDQIASPGDGFETVVGNVVDWAEKHGRLLELAKVVAKQRPQRSDLADLVVEMTAASAAGAVTLPDRVSGETAAPPKETPAARPAASVAYAARVVVAGVALLVAVGLAFVWIDTEEATADRLTRLARFERLTLEPAVTQEPPAGGTGRLKGDASQFERFDFRIEARGGALPERIELKDEWRGRLLLGLCWFDQADPKDGCVVSKVGDSIEIPDHVRRPGSGLVPVLAIFPLDEDAIAGLKTQAPSSFVVFQ